MLRLNEVLTIGTRAAAEHVHIMKEKWPRLTALRVTSLLFIPPHLLGFCCNLELGGLHPRWWCDQRSGCRGEEKAGGQHIEEAMKSALMSCRSKKNGLAGILLADFSQAMLLPIFVHPSLLHVSQAGTWHP